MPGGGLEYNELFNFEVAPFLLLRDAINWEGEKELPANEIDARY